MGEALGGLSRRRLLAVVCLTLVVITSGGCEGSRPEQGTGPLPTPRLATPVASPDSSYPAVTPAPSCPTVLTVTSSLLRDPDWDFDLVMPASWVNLRPGDDGWVTLYGKHGTGTEQRVADGEIQDYAVPLHPQDDDKVVTLTVYVDQVDNEDLAAEGRDYESIITSLSGTPLGTKLMTLPAGRAVRVVATYPDDAQLPTFYRRVVAYMLYHGGYRYALVMVSAETSADHYAPVFECMATSLHFEGAGPQPRPSATAAPSSSG